MSWPAARRPPSSEYLLADAQPAMSTPMTDSDDTARAKKMPVSRSSTTRSGPAGIDDVEQERRHEHDERAPAAKTPAVGLAREDVLLLEELDAVGR